MDGPYMEPLAWPYENWPHADLAPLKIRGASPFLKLKDPKGGDMSEWPEWARVRRFPVNLEARGVR
jgi:hypothetical protein